MSAWTMRRAVASRAVIPPDPTAMVSADLCRLVLWCLAHYADEHDIADPSVAELADATQLAERGVRYALRRLEAAGLIQAVGSRSGGRHPTRYRVVVG